MSKKTKQLMATLALLVLVVLQTVLSLPRHNNFGSTAADSGNEASPWSRSRAVSDAGDWRSRHTR